jgi:hypothetical protein
MGGKLPFAVKQALEWSKKYFEQRRATFQKIANDI